MKQKIVIKVCMPCETCRTKAMEVAARADGVISMAIITGNAGEKLEVVSEGIDVACLVKCLRKKVGYADILQVEEVKDKKAEEKKKPEEPKAPQPVAVVVHPPPPSCCCPGYCYCNHYPKPPLMMVCELEEEPNHCAIM